MRPNYPLSHPSFYVWQMKHKLAVNDFPAFPALTLSPVVLPGAFIVVGTLYSVIYLSLSKDMARLCVLLINIRVRHLRIDVLRPKLKD